MQGDLIGNVGSLIDVGIVPQQPHDEVVSERQAGGPLEAEDNGQPEHLENRPGHPVAGQKADHRAKSSAAGRAEPWFSVSALIWGRHFSTALVVAERY